ncbi:MAG TPA: NAD(+) synthase [Verrucomicrobiales bacterium]|nr:NAD(+) synthase [Verrucomicrobiales bacterium]
MHPVRVAAAAVNQTPLDWEGNLARISEAVQLARDAGASILCLPELSITGYGCEDAFFMPAVAHTALEILDTLRTRSEGLLVAVGLPVFCQGSLYNTAALLADGVLTGLVAKQALAGDGIHYEPRWFKPWPAGVVRHIPILGRSIPIGDLLFDCGGLRIGFEICEDAWVSQRPGSRLARRAVDLILNPSASHFAFGKQRIRERFVLEGSRAFHATYLYANLLGNEAGRAIYDGGTLIAAGGRLLAAGPRFGFDRVRVLTAVSDVDLTRVARAMAFSTQAALAHRDDGVIPLGFTPPRVEPAPPREPAFDGMGKEEEFTQALTLGLYDYITKSRSHGVVISLSGGADSAAVATLTSLTIEGAYRALGHRAWTAAGIPPTLPLAEIKRRLLNCVYQSTSNSSTVTRDAASAVAEALGARFHLWDVDSFVKEYRRLVESSLDRPLDWNSDDITLQNIQARARAPGVWMLANALGALLLSTSNRSEVAVGYATMDGDTCGGFSPIAGIDKAFLRQWLHWMETAGSSAFPPIPALAAVNAQTPTAELRPPDKTQTDEADLMPYPVLDAIERSAIRDKRAPAEALSEMKAIFPQYSPDQLLFWVDRFFRLFCRNQWKRERYAPCFHVDDENLDPRTWCRFPILSGGFEEELRRLAAGHSSSGEAPGVSSKDPARSCEPGP